MYYSNDSQILSFAFSEFRRLLCEMDRNAAVERAFELSENVLSFSVCPEHFSVNDPVLDDGYRIRIRNLSGVIAAPNERSILLGVYRFFSELGCLFSRPGKMVKSSPMLTAVPSLSKSTSSLHTDTAVSVLKAATVSRMWPK